MNKLPLQASNKKLPTEYAQELSDLILTHTEATENQRKIAQPIVEKLKAYNLFKMGLPKSLEGWADTPVETLKVFEALASADASVAWVVWNSHTSAALGRYLDEKSLHEIFSASTHAVANAGNPHGIAQQVTGGFKVSGQWSIVSGCEIADWFILRCLISAQEEPMADNIGAGADLKWFFVPKEEVKVIDTWQLGGLQGTGSHDIVVNNAFVKPNHVIDFDRPLAIDSAYSRLTFACINAAGCSAIALGVLQGAIDALLHICLEKVTTGNKPDLRDRERVQTAIAKSKALLSSNRLQLHNSVSTLWECAQNNITYTDEQLADVWASAVEAAREARSMVSELFDAAGTASLYKINKIEKAHRDIHAVLQHGMLQPHWMTLAGMAYVGLNPPSLMFRA